MRFKQWLETMTSTSCIAGFSRQTLPMVRRVWPMDWGSWKDQKKKKVVEQPQVKEVFDSDNDDPIERRFDRNSDRPLKRKTSGYFKYYEPDPEPVRRQPQLPEVNPQQPINDTERFLSYWKARNKHVDNSASSDTAQVVNPSSYSANQRVPTQNVDQEPTTTNMTPKNLAPKVKQRYVGSYFWEAEKLMYATLVGEKIPEESYGSEGDNATKIARSYMITGKIPDGLQKRDVMSLRKAIFHKKFGVKYDSPQAKKILAKFGRPPTTPGHILKLAVES